MSFSSQDFGLTICGLSKAATCAYALQEKGMYKMDANIHLGFAADERDYAVAIAILKQFELKKSAC
jgi:GTP cyclohydrolase II